MPEHESMLPDLARNRCARRCVMRPDALANRPASSADDLDPAGTDPVHGRGRVNARRAVP